MALIALKSPYIADHHISLIILRQKVQSNRTHKNTHESRILCIKTGLHKK